MSGGCEDLRDVTAALTCTENIQGEAGWGSEQPDPVQGVPAHGRAWTRWPSKIPSKNHLHFPPFSPSLLLWILTLFLLAPEWEEGKAGKRGKGKSRKMERQERSGNYCHKKKLHTSPPFSSFFPQLFIFHPNPSWPFSSQPSWLRSRKREKQEKKKQEKGRAGRKKGRKEERSGNCSCYKTHWHHPHFPPFFPILSYGFPKLSYKWTKVWMTDGAGMFWRSVVGIAWSGEIAGRVFNFKFVVLQLEIDDL